MIDNSIIFIFSFFLLLLSTIGYGLLFNNLCFKKINDLDDKNSIFIGFYGLFFLTFISLFSSLIIQHNFFHNVVLHIIGILLLMFLPSKNKKKYILFLFFLAIILFSALLISKTHDDFSYYHLPFTKYLTEQKVIFGMGHLNHGYNLLSSIFFLNSIYYLPFIEYYSFHFSQLFFLIFFNYFIYREVLDNKNHNILKILYLIVFVFFNLSFNRLAEYGTDKAGQLLLVLIVIKFFQYICFNTKNKNLNKLLLLIPLLGLCISLKTYFLPYILLGLLVIIIDIKKFEIIKKIFFSKSFLVFSLLLILNFSHHFIATGCFVSPLPFTCFGDNVHWGKKISVINELSIWLEQWAKAGAGPNFQVENVSEYISNIQWVKNWFEKYFLVKFLDQLVLLISSILVIFLFFKKFKLKKKNLNVKKNFYLFYTLIIIIFLIWFLKHPTLRYGGYSIVFLFLSIPIAFIFEKFENKNLFNKKFNLLIILIFILFNVKNINRINKEFERGDMYKFDNFPFFAIEKKEFSPKKFNSGLTLFSAHHCWATPSPCGQVGEEINVVKKRGYYLIYQNNLN